jgi:hypothetical protein
VRNLGGATDLSASPYATCAISDAARVSCWGDDTFGQLGTRTRSDPRPQRATRLCRSRWVCSTRASPSRPMSRAGVATATASSETATAATHCDQ